MKKAILIILLLAVKIATAQKSNYSEIIAKKANHIEQKVIEWRHHFYQNSVLGSHERRTAAIIVYPLKSLGLNFIIKGMLNETDTKLFGLHYTHQSNIDDSVLK